jgi:hypothetical protein
LKKKGKIWIADEDGGKSPAPFLDLENRVGSQGDQQGLLSLSFHPQYQDNGYFFVLYTGLNGNTFISRFSVMATGASEADPASEAVLMEILQPLETHNGGSLKFGPDGYLYIALGDGGFEDDLVRNSQKRNTLLGKILRLDVDSAFPYGIPPGNPFVNDPMTKHEIWSTGLRHPWRFSFDRVIGDLWIGDQGQNKWEEINRQPASSQGGENYGWNCYEGAHDFITAGCEGVGTMTFPAFEYPHFFTTGYAVAGGYVYRGCEFPGLYGKYIFTDYVSGRFWTLLQHGGGTLQVAEVADLIDNNYIGFGENTEGQLFVIGRSDGTISKITSGAPLLNYEEDICSGVNTVSLNIPVTQDIDFEWSNGSAAYSQVNLETGMYNDSVTTENGCYFTDSIQVNASVINDFFYLLYIAGC